ncbi:MAG: DUF1553 domain-containing protein [Planctomycetota bacterium]|nr:DUF1553 domain-containing protein [Planctomycetota bacterium]
MCFVLSIHPVVFRLLPVVALWFWAFAGHTLSGQSFVREITPVLTKAGCNQGACHGAAAGRGGFRLSLYGSDPEADFHEIVMRLGGRRINHLDPQSSLLLLKATETIEHGGGQRLVSSGSGAARIEQWIDQGAKWNVTDESSRSATEDTAATNDFGLQQLQVEPILSILSHQGQTIPLKVTATFENGDSENVTGWTVFKAEDESAVSIDPDTGEITVNRRGRHIVIARYLNQVVPVELVLPFLSEDEASLREKTARPNLPEVPRRKDPSSLVDHWVNQKLDLLNLPSSPSCDDATFLRRACLDLTGRLPTPSQTNDYLKLDSEVRRTWLVDSLLSSDEFNCYWTQKLAKLFRLRKLPDSRAAMEAYHRWLGQQLEEHAGYDSIVKALLLARGDTTEVGPANFYRTADNPRERAELVSEVFMASRLRCANCHNHPLDQWTQDDYHGLAAILATISVSQSVVDQPAAKVTHPKTGRDALPKLPAGAWLSREVDADQPLATEFVDWLVAKENPLFAKAIVNRLWKVMMGRGLVDPVDDFRQTNPATHPELLEELSSEFVKSGYDIRAILRVMANSNCYQRSAVPQLGNVSDVAFYSHYNVRPLQAEVLADAISDVLDSPLAYGNQPIGTRAVELMDPQTPSRALDTLGRCSPESSCDQSLSTLSAGLGAKLFLLNGDFINQRLENENNRLSRWITRGYSDSEIVRDFYQLALQRLPRSDERAYWERQLGEAQSDDRDNLLRDFLWSLLACREFTHNQ